MSCSLIEKSKLVFKLLNKHEQSSSFTIQQVLPPELCLGILRRGMCEEAELSFMFVMISQ